MAGDKTDLVTMGATAKAMVKTFIVVYVKGRRFFIMKWAASLKLAPGTGELNTFSDNIGQARTGAYVFKKTFGN